MSAMDPQRRHLLATGTLLTGSMALGWQGVAQAQPAPPSAASAEARAGPLPATGSALALPEVRLFDGTVFRPAQAEGRVLVIYWWASTCPFCALQSPEIQKLWLAERARPQGLLLLSLSVDRKPEDATDYLKKKGYNFPAGYVTPEVHRILPKPRGLPVTVVRGRNGRVLQAEKGQLFPEDVELLARWAA
jgi:hypothetical protein